MPLTADGAQLMDFTVVGMEEVASFRDSLDMFGLQGTLHPSSGAHALAMLALLSNHVDCVAHLVFDTSGSCGH